MTTLDANHYFFFCYCCFLCNCEYGSNLIRSYVLHTPRGKETKTTAKDKQSVQKGELMQSHTISTYGHKITSGQELLVAGDNVQATLTTAALAPVAVCFGG